MAVRKNYIYTSIVFFVASLVTFVFADQFAMWFDSNAFALRVSAGVLVVYCIYKFIFEFLPSGTKNTLINVSLIGWVSLYVILIVASIVLARNRLWQLSLILYFVLSATAFVLRLLQQNGSLTHNDKNLWIAVLVWFISTVAVCITSYKLFESELPFFKYSWRWETIYPIAIVGLLAYFIWTGKWLDRICYVATFLGLSLCAIIYWGLLPMVGTWSLFICYCMVAIICMPILIWICVKNYPNLEGTLAVILIMLIMKGLDVCYGMPCIEEYIKNIINNYGI